MIKRVVKMTFQEEHVGVFLAIFRAVKDDIRAFPGCQHLELWRSTKESNLFFTYSYWESEESLNLYRHSDLFKRTWAKTKILFSRRPEAWSVIIEEIAP